jgi:hypothetical protein
MVLWCDNCAMHMEHAGDGGQWRCRACGKRSDTDIPPPPEPPNALSSPGRRRMGNIGIGHGKWPADIPPQPALPPKPPPSSPDRGFGHGKW